MSELDQAVDDAGHGGRDSQRPRKQEQLPASDEVVEVAPGVLRMQLPIQFTGLGHVNMYGLIDGNGLAVIDPGLPGRSQWKSVVAALRRAGYHVDTVTNGVDAVRAVQENDYDVVLMDCQLPVMTGLEATTTIREHPGPVSRVPIIAISAFTSEHDQAAALASGMDTFIKKPLDIDELLSLLDQWMHRHAMA
jgi:CheY-like chemotaxis protein